MICSELPGSAADQPNLLLPEVQTELPAQQIVDEVMSTVLADVLPVSVCAVRFDGAMVYGELNPVLVAARLTYGTFDPEFQDAKFQSQNAYRYCVPLA
jgi:hypothetical protein